MVLVKYWPFSQHFLLGKMRQENVFYGTVERENGFLKDKNKKLKKWKNWSFSKGGSPLSWSKIGLFSNILFPTK